MLRNHRRERFAQFIAEGKTYTAAYELAGYKPNPANAAFLAKAPEVNSRITEINSERARMQQESTAAAVKSLAITKETLIAKAEEVRLQAMGEPSALGGHCGDQRDWRAERSSDRAQRARLARRVC
jgi:phage terminase small subunit